MVLGKGEEAVAGATRLVTRRSLVMGGAAACFLGLIDPALARTVGHHGSAKSGRGHGDAGHKNSASSHAGSAMPGSGHGGSGHGGSGHGERGHHEAHAHKTAANAKALPERALHLTNPYTGEHMREVYWAHGHYVPATIKRVDHLMRDVHTDTVTKIDPALMDLLWAVHNKVEAQGPFQILSGYRTQHTNEMLREEGYGAAADSMHLYGKAADIAIPSIRLSFLEKAATSMRAGGVGYYPDHDFVHMDTGALRHWEG